MLHDLSTISLPIAGKVYKLYVADSESEKIQGLSGVKSLGDVDGMIFPYDSDKPRTFQFKDTCLPLVVYFIGANGKVLQKSTSSPYQQENITCSKPCRWVIEIINDDQF